MTKVLFRKNLGQGIAAERFYFRALPRKSRQKWLISLHLGTFSAKVVPLATLRVIKQLGRTLRKPFFPRGRFERIYFAFCFSALFRIIFAPRPAFSRGGFLPLATFAEDPKQRAAPATLRAPLRRHRPLLSTEQVLSPARAAPPVAALPAAAPPARSARVCNLCAPGGAATGPASGRGRNGAALR